MVFDETRRKGTQNIIIFEGRHTKKNISPDVVVQRTHSLKTSLSTSTKRMPTASNPNATRLPTTCIAGRRDTESPTAAANPIRARSKENISFFLSVCLSLSSANALSPANCDDDDQYNTIRFKNSLSLFPLSLSLSPKNPLSVFLSLFLENPKPYITPKKKKKKKNWGPFSTNGRAPLFGGRRKHFTFCIRQSSSLVNVLSIREDRRRRKRRQNDDIKMRGEEETAPVRRALFFLTHTYIYRLVLVLCSSFSFVSR